LTILQAQKSADVVYKKAASKVKELIILKDCYHLIVMDNEKEFVVNKTLEFIDRISPSDKTESLEVSARN